MRLKRLLNPWPDAPLPLWMIFPVIFAALYATPLHAAAPALLLGRGRLLHSRRMGLLPHRLADPHHHAQQRPSAAAQHLSRAVVEGLRLFPEVTREAVLMVAALGLLGVWRLAMRLVGVASVAFWTALLTGLYPIWFAQSSLAHADIFAAACSLWGLVYALPAARPQALGRGALVFCRCAVQRDVHRHSAHPGGGQPGRELRAPAAARQPRSGAKLRGSQPACFRWPLVCLPLREDRLPLRQSRVPALQRRGHARAAADSGRLRPPHPASHRAHEHVCAGAAWRWPRCC